MGEFSEAGLVTAALAEEEADLAASRGLDSSAGLEDRDGEEIEAAADQVVLPPRAIVRYPNQVR